jgi:hypothetical protein
LGELDIFDDAIGAGSIVKGDGDLLGPCWAAGQEIGTAGTRRGDGAEYFGRSPMGIGEDWCRRSQRGRAHRFATTRTCPAPHCRVNPVRASSQGQRGPGRQEGQEPPSADPGLMTTPLARSI